MKLKLKFRTIVTIAALSFSILFGLVRISDPEIVEVLRLKYFDTLQKFTPRETKGHTYTVIVDIDEKSLEEVGQWPWSRTVLADLFKKSAEAGMLVLGLDILFAEPDRTSPNLIAEDIKLKNPVLSEKLSLLPTNEEVAVKYMLKKNEKFNPSNPKLKIVLGHSALNSEGDAKRKDVQETSVKASIGKNPKEWLNPYIGLLANVGEFEKNAFGAGTISLAQEPDGIIRRVPLISNIAEKIRPTLALEMIRVAFQGNSIATKTGINGIESVLMQTKAIGKAAIPTDASGRVWIHYGSPDEGKGDNSRYYVSAVDIIKGRVGKDRLQGKLGIMGTSATGLKDIKPTSVEERMPGVEVHANLIDTLIDAILYYTSKKRSDDIYNAAIKKGLPQEKAILESQKVKITGSPFLRSGVNMPFYEALFVILLGFLFTLSALKFGPILNISFLGLILGSAFYLSMKLYLEDKILFDPTFASFSTFIIYFSTTFANYLRDANEKKQIRGAFSQYLSPALVEQLAADPDKLVLGGETKKMTFLFCDVRGFTTISESFKSDPQGLTKLINRFLTPLTNEIISHNGTIDKYMGDCIMAFWNAPISVKTHEMLSCDATLKMHSALHKLNKEREMEAKENNKKFLELKIGIGVNTGDCVVGNMGSDQRFDYSVLGDAVNLASRLEGQSKGYGVKTVLGPETYEAVNSDYATLQLDNIAVKGKKEAVSIYTLLGNKEFKENSAFKLLETKHKLMLKNYFNQEWDQAMRIILECEGLMDKIMFEYYSIIKTRINEFKKNPPPQEWDGVFVATSK
ncbi:MAG: adenylate/guanylate cyclase domain-containing protein [Rickettsiales bacterium]|nr:adenylate/guanylate cyclase domain-containing protein [Rickettsiales bacterium]